MHRRDFDVASVRGGMDPAQTVRAAKSSSRAAKLSYGIRAPQRMLPLLNLRDKTSRARRRRALGS